MHSYLTPLRQPARARAGSATCRRFILPEAAWILAGRYRGARLRTPTRILYGLADPGIRPELLGGYEPYADDLTVHHVEGASHFIVDDRPDAVLDHARELFGSG